MTRPSFASIDTLFLIGPTGVGKSPLGDHIARSGLFGRRCHHLDFGSELRSLAACGPGTAGFTDEEIFFIQGVLERGLLLENDRFPLAVKIIHAFLVRSGFKTGNLLVLNGIPRHRGQAEDVSRYLAIHCLVVLDCTADTVLCRLKNNVGGDRHDRTDDRSDLVAQKLTLFRERTAPLVDHYALRGTTVYRLTVCGQMTAETAYGLLRSLASADPPVSLVSEPPQG